VLVARVERDPGAAGDRGALRQVVVHAARATQQRLRAVAHPLGERLLAARPGELRSRVALYWQTAQAISAAERKPVDAPPEVAARSPRAARARKEASDRHR
jgi:hypothetical protein